MVKRTITFLFALCVAVAGHAAPFAWSVNSDGPDSHTSDSLYRIDLETGSAQLIGKVRANDSKINSDIEGLAFDLNGDLYGVDDADETLLRINTSTGAAISATGNSFNLQLNTGDVYDFGMTFTCDGSVLMTSDQTQTLYSFETIDPAARIVGSVNSLVLPITGIAAHGDEVYGIGQGVNDNLVTLIPNLYRIDRVNGTATMIGPLGSSVHPYTDAGLAFDEEGQLWALTDRSDFGSDGLGSELIRIDTQTGAALQVLPVNVIGFESLAITAPTGCQIAQIQPLAIPAAGNAALLLLALLLSLVAALQIRRFA